MNFFVKLVTIYIQQFYKGGAQSRNRTSDTGIFSIDGIHSVYIQNILKIYIDQGFKEKVK
jgi:hypothetical protein